VQERSEELRTLACEQGFQYFSAQEIYRQGWVLTEQGQGKDGIIQMRRGMAATQATGAELAKSFKLAWLAEAYGKVGQPEKGLAVLTEALAFADKTDERVNEAELYRLKGELVLQSGVRGPESQEENQKAKGKGQKAKIHNTQPLAPSTQEAEACFHKAIEIARHQQAKSLELRAAMSLARLRQGKAGAWLSHSKAEFLYTQE